MPWSLKKLLSPKDQQTSSDGGDKGREKKSKSKSAKSSKKKLKSQTKSPNATNVSYTEPLKGSTDSLNTSGKSLDTSGRTDLSIGRSSDDASLASGEIISIETVKSDEDCKSADDFQADCSNLTGYLETAILESACNTLERNRKTDATKSTTSQPQPTTTQAENMTTVSDELAAQSQNQPSSDQTTYDTKLLVEYVNYDVLMVDDVIGDGEEYFTSDDDDNNILNSNNNSNHEAADTLDDDLLQTDSTANVHARRQDKTNSDAITASVRETQDSSINNAFYNRDEAATGHENTTELSEKRISSDQLKRNESLDTASEKRPGNAISDSHSQEQVAVFSAENQIVIGVVSDHYQINDRSTDGVNLQAKCCPIHNEYGPDINTIGNISDMEKAKSIFGMCLCQNGEQVDHVTELDFRNSNLKQVPHEIFQYAQTLTHLQLDSNTLSDLPKSLFSCDNLEYLTVSDNDLSSLPPTLAGLSNLKYLDISKNVIEDVPDCIRCCKSLSILDASVNPIEKLSEGFTQLVGLTELYLNDCFLEFLPGNFGRLVQLTVLELRDNQLQILPKSIRRLTLLRRLDLGGNILQEWPDVICELRRLTELWLDGNEMMKVPEQIGDLTSLVYLDLSRNFIETLPNQIGSLRELTDLLLCENHIAALPDTIGFLDKLTMLKASMNQLTGLPESIGKLQDMEELDLSHNKLDDVPPTIGNLTLMHTLLLDNNRLRFVPPEIGGCEKLNVLQLSRNMLHDIPKEIGDLSELRVFNICGNSLSHLPITVIKLAQLEALWVSSNQSKPNVPLHAELGPDGKTRILTNILFPQVGQDAIDSRVMTDQDGYANDAADDDEPPLFRKQRGVTRVAFNLEPVCHDTMDDYSDEEYQENGDMVIDVPMIAKDHNSNDKFLVPDHVNSIDVSDAVMTSNGLLMQPITLSVRSPEKSDASMDAAEDPYDPHVDVPDSIPFINGVVDYDALPSQFQDVTMETPSMISDYTDVTPIDMIPPFESSTAEKSNDSKSFSVPDLRKNTVTDNEDTTKSSPAIESPTDGNYEDSPKIKTWSSHSHLPAIPTRFDDVTPVSMEIDGDRSSVDSSRCSEIQKTEPQKITKLPVPSRAIFENAAKSPETIAEIKIDASPRPPRKNPLADIPFMDGEISDESDAASLASKLPVVTPPKKVKPPPPPRKDSLSSKSFSKYSNQTEIVSKPPVPTSKPTMPPSTGLKIFTPALLQKQRSDTVDMNDTSLPPPLLQDTPPVLSLDGLPSTDRDSGVGNDVDSQESIPECADEESSESNMVTSQDLSSAKGVVKSVARFQIGDVRGVTPGSDSNASSQPPPVAPKPSNIPNKISASIKMFESISASPENKGMQAGGKTLADLLPGMARKVEEKAIIRPNNHLNDHIEGKQLENRIKSADVKPDAVLMKSHGFREVITAEPQPVMFLRDDDDDVIADVSMFSKALTEIAMPPERKKVTRSRSDSGESAKQSQFRERLEKIMQQQKSVSSGSKSGQNGTALSLSRKTSFNTNSQPTSPDGSGLEKLTAENTFPVADFIPTLPTHDVKSPTKKPFAIDKLKSKLDRGNSGSTVKTTSSSRNSRSRPGSAPALQLLQRRNSNQRNSIAAPENSYDDKRIAAPQGGAEEQGGTLGRSRSKSIEQQLGQLFLDSDEERLNRDEKLNHERRYDDQRWEQHRLKKDSSGIRGSRNSLCSPPPVRHNMYAKARSSTNAATAPLADWKHKLLQHVERKRLEKQQITALQNMNRSPRTQQPQKSIGKIKSPPRTSGPGSKQQGHYDQYNVHHQPQPRQPINSQRNMGQKSVTAPALMAAPKMVTNTHVYRPEGQGVRSHFAGHSRAARLAKQRTFTPGPEAHGNAQMLVPRPKSAMDNFSPQHQVEPSYAEPPSYRQPTQPVLYADLRSYKQPPLPTYEDYLHRHVPYQQETPRLTRAESSRKSYRGAGHKNYEDVAGYPLRQSGSHESLMDAARYNQHHDPYFPSTPLRNASSHDSVLDQQPYQPASYMPQYSSPSHQQRYQNNHVPQRYPVNEKRNKYANQDYATYVNLNAYDYEQTPAEYHKQPQMHDQYQQRLGYRNSVRTKRQQQAKQDPSSYANYAYPPNYHNTRQAPTYEQHYRQQREPVQAVYRPVPEREDESVASAFRPYHQIQQPARKSHHHNPYMHSQSYGLPPNQVMMPNEYKNAARHMSPSNYQYIPEQPRHMNRPPPQGWSDSHEDFERVTVSVRRNPTFGFHVSGGIGAGGNSYRPADEGVFVTHVSPGGAADNKLQPGDKILMVNGSDFVGISHQRAVDLLRNAGKVAVIVVERSLGKAV